MRREARSVSQPQLLCQAANSMPGGGLIGIYDLAVGRIQYNANPHVCPNGVPVWELR
jgi:hypothetical protein